MTTEPDRSAPDLAADLACALGATPTPLPDLVTAVRPAHPQVAEAEARAALEEQPRAFQVVEGWVDLVAAADNVVLTHVLSADERAHGVLAADGDLDLWSWLAAEDGLPLAGGGRVTRRRPPDTVTGADGELTGPDGWLHAFAPDQLLAVRLRGGALEVTGLDRPPDAEPAAASELLAYAVVGAWAALDVYLEERGENPDGIGAATPVGWLVANLVANRPGVLREPLPPLSELLPIVGLEVDGPFAWLPGVPKDPDEAAWLDAEQLRVRARAAMFVRSAGMGDGRDPKDLAGLLDAVAAQGVTAYLADLVETDGLPEPAVTALRDAATTPSQRALAALVAARAAEGAGDPARAERLVAEALAHQPGLVPALRDAGEYAATRGDAAAADGFFNRAGLPRDGPWRLPLAKVVAPPAGSTPRNRPCPCGSGRKYKLCCLRHQVHPLPVRAPLLYAKLAGWVKRVPHRDRLAELTELATGQHPAPELLALDLALFDDGLVDRFLATRGALLPDDERGLAERWRESRLVPYEVAQVRPGTSATLRPLPGGDPVELRDRALSTSVRRLDLLVARLLPDGGQPRVLALPGYVPRSRRHELLRLFEDYSPEALAGFFGPQPPPRLQNREGHELVSCEATYHIPDPDDCWWRLATRLEAGDDDPDLLTLLRPVDGNELLVAGSVRRDGPEWLVETNSVERLRELHELVLAAAPEARLVEESTEPMTTALVERLARNHGPPRAPAVPDLPGAAEALAEVVRSYERRWLDEPVPALSGATPRQAAAAGGEALAELRALLDDMEWRGGDGLMDADRLRAELGLTD